MKYFLSNLFCLICMHVGAQPMVDLCVAKDTDHWMLIAKPHGTFEGIFSNIQFSIKLDEPGGSILSVLQSAEVAAYMPIQLAGTSQSHQGAAYQKLVGVSSQTLAESGIFWEADSSVALAKIYPSDMNLDLSISREKVTDLNNGTFYIELDGKNVSGDMFSDCIANIVMVSNQPEILSKRWNIYPNPATNFLRIEADYVGDLSISIRNAMGQLLLTKKMNYAPGISHEIDISYIPEGFIFVELWDRDQREVISVLKSP